MKADDFQQFMRKRAARVHSLVSCCSQNHVRLLRQLTDPTIALVSTVTDRPVVIRRARLSIQVREWWHGAGSTAVLQGAHYILRDRASEREILAFHRHSGVFAEGHYHLGAGAGPLPTLLEKIHLPAPGVTLEAFIEMLVFEFGFPARSDWREILAIST